MSSFINSDMALQFDEIVAHMLELSSSLSVRLNELIATAERESAETPPTFLQDDRCGRIATAIRDSENTQLHVKLPTRVQMQRLKWLEQTLEILFEHPKIIDAHRYTNL